MTKARRRGHGEGAIYQRESDGRWVATLDLGYIDGKRKRRSLYGATRREVADKLKAAQRERDLGMPMVSPRLTLADFIKTWLAEDVFPSLAPRTYETYERHMRLYVIPVIGHVPLTKLTRQDVERVFTRMETSREQGEGGLAPRTIKGTRATLRAALNDAMRQDLVGRNVAALTEPRRVEQSDRPFLTPEQATKLLEAAKGTRLEAFCTVALSLGLRRGEALGLKWADIDLEHRQVRVWRALQRTGGKLILRDQKSKRSRRTLPLPAVMADVLVAHRTQQNIEREIAGDRWQDNDLVFASQIGTPFEPNNVSNMFKALAIKAGLPIEFRLHDLRHSCTSLLIALKVDARIIMAILGHADIGTTMNIYGHLFPSATREVMDLMDGVLRPNKPSEKTLAVNLAVSNAETAGTEADHSPDMA